MTLACALGVKSESGGITAEEIGGDREELCPLQHDDDIGEDVTSEQADMVCESIIRQVTPQSATLVEVQTWVHVRTTAWSGLRFLEASLHQNCHSICSQAVLYAEAFCITASGRLRATQFERYWAAAAGVLKAVML